MSVLLPVLVTAVGYLIAIALIPGSSSIDSVPSELFVRILTAVLRCEERLRLVDRT